MSKAEQSDCTLFTDHVRQVNLGCLRDVAGRMRRVVSQDTRRVMVLCVAVTRAIQSGN